MDICAAAVLPWQAAETVLSDTGPAEILLLDTVRLIRRGSFWYLDLEEGPLRLVPSRRWEKVPVCRGTQADIFVFPLNRPSARELDIREVSFLSLGSDPGCSLCIPGAEKEHIFLQRLEGWGENHILQAAGPGVELGGRALPQGTRVQLRDGDSVVMPGFRFVYHPEKLMIPGGQTVTCCLLAGSQERDPARAEDWWKVLSPPPPGSLPGENVTAFLYSDEEDAGGQSRQDRDGEEKVDLRNLEQLTIGRLPDCGITVRGPAVSRTHLVLRRTGPESHELEVDGANGAHVSGERITSGGRVFLRWGDTVKIPGFQFLYFGDWLEPACAEGVEYQVKVPLVPEQPEGEACIGIQRMEQVTVGRDPSCDICVDCIHVSRVHLLIRRSQRKAEAGAPYAYEMVVQGKTGAAVRGVRLETGATVPLEYGDTVTVPGFSFLYHPGLLQISSRQTAPFRLRDHPEPVRVQPPVQPRPEEGQGILSRLRDRFRRQ